MTKVQLNDIGIVLRDVLLDRADVRGESFCQQWDKVEHSKCIIIQKGENTYDVQSGQCIIDKVQV